MEIDCYKIECSPYALKIFKSWADELIKFKLKYKRMFRYFVWGDRMGRNE